jgi:putative nucleotidyltransferase with HDIG domain
MPRSLKLYIAGLVAAGTTLLAATTFVPGFQMAIAWNPGGALGTDEAQLIAGLAYWIALCLAAQALPVRFPRGMVIAVSSAPIIAAMALGGPAAAGWVALIGVTEIREIRGRIPWYGTAANHAGIVVAAVLGGCVTYLLKGDGGASEFQGFVAVIAGATVMFALNVVIVSVALSLRTGLSVREMLYADTQTFASSYFAMAPLGWLMARTYAAEGSNGWWATLVFALPLYTTRLAYQQVAEVREMFTQTIEVLAEAVDKRDPFTSKHSRNVMLIARDIGRELRLGEADLEALEWGGLLHDVGKIGVPDSVLLKQERLTREERISMNSHPVLGAEIIAPVTRLSRELPIIRNHHEWYNGSGYPDRLIGDEIPLLARILHVADAFEAMTAKRPYRMVPLTAEQALGELRKFAGIQFDPRMVDAFVRTKWVEGVPDPGRATPPRPIPLISQHAAQMAGEGGTSATGSTSAVSTTSGTTPTRPTGAPAATSPSGPSGTASLPSA